MINFYLLGTNLYQVCIRDLSIYYSFKMPIAYRVKKDLKIRRGMNYMDHFYIITAGHTYVETDPNAFDFNLKHLFKQTIYNLAEDYTKDRMNIKQEEKHKPIYIGELNACELGNSG